MNIEQLYEKYGPLSMLRTPYRPFLSLKAPVLLGSADKQEIHFGGVETSSRTHGTFGGVLGTGLDVLLGRHFMLGTTVGFSAVTDFSEPFAGRKNYSSFEADINFSWIFGKGY